MTVLNSPKYLQSKALIPGDLVSTPTLDEMGFVLEFDGDNPIIGYLSGPMNGQFYHARAEAFWLNYGSDWVLEILNMGQSQPVQSSAELLLGSAGAFFRFRGHKELVADRWIFSAETHAVADDAARNIIITNWRLWHNEQSRVSVGTHALLER